MKNREEGYYWVKLKGDEMFHAAFYDGDWTLCGTEEFFSEKRDLEEIGEKIKPPTPKHVHKFTAVRGREGKEFNLCSCGQISVPEGFFSHDDIMKIREELNTPGAVFHVTGI